MGIVTYKSNVYFVNSLENPKEIMIISPLVTGSPKKINDYFVTPHYFPPKKVSINSLLDTVPKKRVSIISLVVNVPSKKVTIKSLVIIFPNIKVPIICYLLLFHMKSNDRFVNCYFPHTKYVS